MIKLKVPFAEKDQARLLGAKWDAQLRTWYVPKGMLLSPFECWLPMIEVGATSQATSFRVGSKSKTATTAPKTAVNGYVAAITTGALYFDTGHGCDPLEPCAACRPSLIASGWLTVGQVLKN